MKSFTVHYEDTFNQKIISSSTLLECLEKIYTNTPLWIGFLLKLRNSIVKIFGLQTEVSQPLDFKKIKKGDTFGFLFVEEIAPSLAIFRGDDKHLNFRIIFKFNKTTLEACTQVQFNNLWGRVYFYSILPFHKVVLPMMLRAAQ